MRRILFFLVLVLLVHCRGSFAGTFTLDEIMLSWKDFQVQELPSGSRYVTRISIPIRYQILPQKSTGEALFESQPFVDPLNSHVDKNFLSHASDVEKQDLLDHEKCHIILAYIYNKKLKQILAQYQFQLSLKSETDSILSIVLAELKLKHQAYDDATEHGRLKVQQELWQRNLLKELNQAYPVGELNAPTFVILKKPLFMKCNDPDEYSYPNLQLLFEEKFDDDHRGWLKEASADSGVFATIANGCLEINNTRKTGNWAYDIEESIDYSRDFEIQVSFMIKKAEGKYTSAGRVAWGLADTPGYSWISISRAKTAIINCHGGDHKNDDRKASYTYPVLKEGTFHTLIVRKIKDRYTVFLDDRFSTKLPFMMPSGNKIGFATEHNSIMVYDFLKIYYLN